ncbi:hypothetical protein KKZ03_12710 [Methylobacter sp. S3L5C]|nr:hypothetical protein KKZ03_12710 [Methylobacter sp. S3L5C]
MAFLTGCAGVERDHVQSDQLSGCPKQTVASLIAGQDQLGPLADTHTLKCALTVLRNTHDSAAHRTALGSHICMHLAERETNQENREKLAAEGVSFAETALAHGGTGEGAVHYYLAANLGMAVREHPTLAIGNLGRLEDEMKQALALSPDLDHGGPLRLLGMLYLKAPTWPNGIGDRDKALELLGKAVKEHPEHPLNHLFYAQALWDEDDETVLPQVKAEVALGQKLLIEGNWGYSKEPWQKEFNEFQQEYQETRPIS